MHINAARCQAGFSYTWAHTCLMPLLVILSVYSCKSRDSSENNELLAAPRPRQDALGCKPGPVPEMLFCGKRGTIHGIGEFEIQDSELTRGQWKAVVENYPEEFDDFDSACLLGTERTTNTNQPVNCVRFSDAKWFAEQISEMDPNYRYTIPTSREWQAASMENGAMPTSSPDPWCDKTGPSKVRANDFLGANNKIYDMSGNLSEWLSSPRREARFLTAGGNWKSHSGDCEATSTAWMDEGSSASYVGFRLVRRKNQ